MKCLSIELLTLPPIKQIAVVRPRSSIGNHRTKNVPKHVIKGPCKNPIMIRVKIKPLASPINEIKFKNAQCTKNRIFIFSPNITASGVSAINIADRNVLVTKTAFPPYFCVRMPPGI